MQNYCGTARAAYRILLKPAEGSATNFYPLPRLPHDTQIL